MATIRKTVEEFIYPFYERFTDMVYRGGEDTVFEGVRVLDDDIKFTHGALVNAAATLYAYYVKVGDSRADEVLDRLHYFIKIAASNVCKTWGKLAILRGFCTLSDAGLVDRIRPEYVELAKEKTNYEDFFDKEKLCLIDLATNYMQVAMACAGMRERLGWENDGFSAKIMDKLSEILNGDTIGGWLDDEIPYGRFDRYSFVLTSEFADTARIAGLPLPDYVIKNIRLAADAMLFLANNRGDGVCYGRSLAIHGDSTPVEVLSTAFAEGLIKDSERDTALRYILAIYKKKLSFWYDEKRGAFNMWWDGRGHDAYRPVDRLLETNLDTVNHLYMQLRNLELAGVCDIEIDGEIEEPESWQSYEMDFVSTERDVRKTVLLKRKGALAMLPFVAFGNKHGNHSSYYPFTAFSGGALEAAPQATYPYFVPEYTDEAGVKYRPVQYYDRVELTRGGDIIRIHAEGDLSIIEGKEAHRSNIRFTLDYEISNCEINVAINSGRKMLYAEMITSDNNRFTGIIANGFDSCKPIVTGGSIEYRGIHGELQNVKIHKAKNPLELGYKIIL